MLKNKDTLLTGCLALLISLILLLTTTPFAFAAEQDDARLSRPVESHEKLTAEEIEQIKSNTPSEPADKNVIQPNAERFSPGESRPTRFLTEEERIVNLAYPFEFIADSIAGDYVTVSFIPYFGIDDYALTINERESLEEYQQRINSGNYQKSDYQEIHGRQHTNPKITLRIDQDYSFSLQYQDGNIKISYDGFLCAITYMNDIEEVTVKTRNIMRNEIDILRAEAYMAEATARAQAREQALVYDKPEIAAATAADNNTASAWARETVQVAIRAGLVPQSLQSEYRQSVSRAEFAALAIRFLETKAGVSADALLSRRDIVIEEAIFSDTDDRQILTAYALGIVAGKGGGIFDPGGSITREEMAAMLTRVSEITEADYFVGGSSNYADRDRFSPWAMPYIDYVTIYGIMGGVGGNRFDPLGYCTREQAITVFYRMLGM